MKQLCHVYGYSDILSETQIEHTAWQLYHIFRIAIALGYFPVVSTEGRASASSVWLSVVHV